MDTRVLDLDGAATERRYGPDPHAPVGAVAHDHSRRIPLRRDLTRARQPWHDRRAEWPDRSLGRSLAPRAHMSPRLRDRCHARRLIPVSFPEGDHASPYG